jgi:hypothetical protein
MRPNGALAVRSPRLVLVSPFAPFRLGRVCPPAIPLQEVAWLTAEGSTNPIQHSCAEHSGPVVVKSKGSRIRDLRLFCEAVDRPITVIQKLPKSAPDHENSVIGTGRRLQASLHKETFTYTSCLSKVEVEVACIAQGNWPRWNTGARDGKRGSQPLGAVPCAPVGVARLRVSAACGALWRLWRILWGSEKRRGGLTGVHFGSKPETAVPWGGGPWSSS